MYGNWLAILMIGPGIIPPTDNVPDLPINISIDCCFQLPTPLIATDPVLKSAKAEHHIVIDSCQLQTQLQNLPASVTTGIFVPQFIRVKLIFSCM